MSSNFGVYASAERRLVFGINDFDETFPGPWEWDLKRLAASAAVVARSLGGKDGAAADAARHVTQSYRQHIREYARMGYLETWYATIDEKDVLAAVSDEARRRGEKVMAKARQRTNTQVLEKMADLVDDQHRIVEQRPFIVRETHTENGQPVSEALDDFLQSYLESLGWDRRRLLERYQIVDVARKVVGVGSVGTRCWVILMKGLDDGDPLFLQVKQAQPSVLQPHAPRSVPFANEGHRVVAGQRMIQGSPDIFLGWGELGGVQFYVRQLRDMKGGTEFREGRTDLDTLPDYCRPVRLGAGVGACQVRRRRDHRRLCRQERGARRRAGDLLAGLRRPDRARLRAARQGRAERAHRGRPGPRLSRRRHRRSVGTERSLHEVSPCRCACRTCRRRSDAALASRSAAWGCRGESAQQPARSARRRVRRLGCWSRAVEARHSSAAGDDVGSAQVAQLQPLLAP